MIWILDACGRPGNGCLQNYRIKKTCEHPEGGIDVEYTKSVLSESFEADLVKDILSIIMVFSAKLYGKRSRENKLKMKELKKMEMA